MDLIKYNGFDWDEHNEDKIWRKHRVHFQEAEQVFLNKPLLTQEDEAHSKNEIRFFSLGSTDEGRLLFVAFTIRRDLIRIVSARPMSKKEKEKYASEKENPSF